MNATERRLAGYSDMLMAGDTSDIEGMAQLMRDIGAWDENGEWALEEKDTT